MFSTASGLPCQLLYASAYNSTLTNLNKLHDNNPKFQSVVPKILLPAVAGVAAEVTSIAVNVPSDVVTQRLQAGDAFKGGVRVVVRDIFRENGFVGFFRGTAVTLLSTLPGGMCWWVTYEAAKEKLATVMPSFEGPISPANATAGAIAGSTTAFLTNPVDVCKTRIQTDRLCYGSTTFFGVFTAAVRHEGLSVLSKGLAGRIFMAAPGSLIHSLSYETVMHFARMK